VRLRSLSRRSPGAEDTGRPFDTGTTVGNLGSTHRAWVDPAGQVTVADAGWSLDWWVGAEDRWHVPGQEVAVRQELVGASPVVETRVRIPNGDAVSRVYGTRGPRGEDLVVVEIHNDSRIPVALALAIQARPGSGHLAGLTLTGSLLEVDGSPALHLGRSPGRIAFSTGEDARPAGEVVLAGDAEPVRAASVTCPRGDARGVLLFPLAHTATLRIAIALDGSSPEVEVASLPSAAQVASGWATHSRGGARIEVPDRRLREAVRASGRFLLLDGDGPVVGRALSHLGFPDEAAARARQGNGRLGAALRERADRWQLHRDGLHDGEEGWVAGVVERWAREPDADGVLALPTIADLLERAGEVRAADDVRALARVVTAPEGPPASDLQGLLASASATWTWSTARSGHDLEANARLLLEVRRHLVAERDDGLALSPIVPEGWLGQGWEVHDLPTAFGLLSFAVRWHGERPALLWELQPHPGAGPIRLSAPSLDPGWSTTERRGDALLAPVPVPDRPKPRRGLRIPVTIEPARRRP
jgi:hypothetical protein